MLADDNEKLQLTIACNYCHKSFAVALLQVTNGAQMACPHCAKMIDLSQYDPEAEKRNEKNRKELDKLRKLLGNTD